MAKHILKQNVWDWFQPIIWHYNELSLLDKDGLSGNGKFFKIF